MPVSSFAYALLSILIAALVGGSGQAGQRAHLLAVFELTPSKEFIYVDPGSIGPNGS